MDTTTTTTTTSTTNHTHDTKGAGRPDRLRPRGPQAGREHRPVRGPGTYTLYIYIYIYIYT